MIEVYLKFIGSLNKNQKINFFFLQFAMAISSSVTLSSVVLIIPFFNYIIQGINLSDLEYINQIQKIIAIDDNKLFNYYTIFLILILFFSSFLSILINYFSVRFTFNLTANLANKIFKNILKLDLKEFKKKSLSDYQSKIILDTDRVVKGVIRRYLIIVNAFLDVLLVFIAMIFYNPKITIALFILLIIMLLFFTSFLKKIVLNNGSIISTNQFLKMHYLNSALNAFKEITILNKKVDFIKKFRESCYLISKKDAINVALTSLPKFLFEFLIIGSVLGAILIIANNKGNIVSYLSVFAVFGFATYKVLPRFNQIYSAIMGIKSNIFAFHNILPEIKNLNKKSLKAEKLKFDEKKIKVFKEINKIELKKIIYKVNGKIILNNLNFKILKNQNILINGLSGSGKSTLIEILLGLIQPDSGLVLINNNLLKKNEKWIYNFSYVTQNIFLINETILYNITLEENLNLINYNKINQICKITGIDQWMKNQKITLNYKIFDNSTNISGGQKQRIGIARALYRNEKVLILDEATNSLDAKSEISLIRKIIKSKLINNLIVISHNKNIKKLIKKSFTLYNKKLNLN